MIIDLTDRFKKLSDSFKDEVEKPCSSVKMSTNAKLYATYSQ